MDNTFHLKLLAEAHQGRFVEERGQARLLLRQQRVAFTAMRKVIVTGGGFLIRTGEALKDIAAPGEAHSFSSNGPNASAWKNSSFDV